MTLTVLKDIEQGSAEWHDARRGIITASTMKHFITAKTMKIANNDTSRNMAMQLLAERITGRTEETYASYDMEMGHVKEPVARQHYADNYSPVEQVAFMVRTERGVRVGYSPDGLVGDDGAIEIKCPKPKEHLATIINGTMPTEYVPQVQTGLWVSGREWVDFVSFNPGMPLYVHRVFPDAEWQKAIWKAVAAFEASAVLVLNAYKEAVAGRPATEPLPEITEMSL